MAAGFNSGICITKAKVFVCINGKTLDLITYTVLQTKRRN